MKESRYEYYLLFKIVLGLSKTRSSCHSTKVEIFLNYEKKISHQFFVQKQKKSWIIFKKYQKQNLRKLANALSI